METEEAVIDVEAEFQFQDGSIKCGLRPLKHLYFSRFNSKMVRLNAPCPDINATPDFVSIPRWFD